MVEGVHLSLHAVARLMAAHPSFVPFLVHISNEAKHRERFAVRSKFMTLEPGGARRACLHRPVGVLYMFHTLNQHFMQLLAKV